MRRGTALALAGLIGFGGAHVPSLRAQETTPAGRPGFIDVAWPGAAIGIGGFLAGGLLGIAIADCPGSEDDGLCALEGGFFGAAALGTIGLATGVHLGNDRRGSFGLDVLTAAGIWGLSIGVLAATGWDDTATTVTFVALPIVQLFATVAVEQAVGDRRVRDRGGLELGLTLAPEGGLALAGGLSF